MQAKEGTFCISFKTFVRRSKNPRTSLWRDYWTISVR